MMRQIAAAVCGVALGLTAPAALARPDTAKTCLREWRTDEMKGRAGGLTERAFLAQCRAGRALPQRTTATAAPAGLSAGSNSGAQDHQVYSSIRELMQSIIDPSADDVWNAVKTVVDQGGIQESFPKTPEEWLDVRHAAVRIIEGGNLLMMPGREAAPAGAKSETPGVELEPAQITALIKNDRKTFDAFAKALQALGVEAMRASDAQNTAALVDVGGQMENVCEGCHQTFWYPPQKHAFTRDPDAASEFGSWAEMLRPARSLLAGVFTEGNFATNSSVDLK